MDPPQNPNVSSLPEYALQVSLGTSDVIEPFVGCRIDPTARVVKHNATLNSYEIEGVPKHRLNHKWYRQHKVEANDGTSSGNQPTDREKSPRIEREGMPWVEVGSSLSYTPTRKDIGCSLMLQTEVVSTYLSLPIDISQTYPVKYITTIADIPYDSLDEILIRLPIPALRASRLVSRDWNSRTVDEEFVSRVLADHATKAKICIHDLYSPGDIWILIIDEDHISTETYVAALPYVHPVKSVDAPYILGSVRDKILFGNEQQTSLFIVTPGRRTSLRIENQAPFGNLYGLVYDEVKRNYYILKVVIEEAEGVQDLTRAFIYSLRKGRWRTRILGNFRPYIHKPVAVGTLNGKFYIWDYTNLVIFTRNMKEFRLLPAPLELREKQLQFGVAREDLSQGQVVDVLLISCVDSETGLTSLWRLRKINEIETFETLAIWNGVHGGFYQEDVKPISYLVGDPNQIVLLVNECSFQVFSLVDHSRREIFRVGHDEENHWSLIGGFTQAIGYYNSFVPEAIKENVVSIKTSRSRRNKKDQPKEDAHALKKLKKD